MKGCLRSLVILALLLPVQALAHAKLTASSPSDGGMLAKGEKNITLTFDALIIEAMCNVVDASGAPVPTVGVPRIDREKVRIALAEAVKPGDYVLTCKVKADRHETDHTVKFAVP